MSKAQNESVCDSRFTQRIQLQKQKFIFRCPKQEGNALANFGSSSGLEPRLLHSKITQMFSLEFWLEMNDLMLNYSHFVAIIKTFFDLVLSVAYL